MAGNSRLKAAHTLNMQEVPVVWFEGSDDEGGCDDPGTEPPPLVPASRPGDLWILGNHVLLRGNSTKPDDVRRVMNPDLLTYARTKVSGWGSSAALLDVRDPGKARLIGGSGWTV